MSFYISQIFSMCNWHRIDNVPETFFFLGKVGTGQLSFSNKSQDFQVLVGRELNIIKETSSFTGRTRLWHKGWHHFPNTESKHIRKISRGKIHFYSQYKHNLVSSGKVINYYPSHQAQLISKGCDGRVVE